MNESTLFANHPHLVIRYTALEEVCGSIQKGPMLFIIISAFVSTFPTFLNKLAFHVLKKFLHLPSMLCVHTFSRNTFKCMHEATYALVISFPRCVETIVHNL